MPLENLLTRVETLRDRVDERRCAQKKRNADPLRADRSLVARTRLGHRGPRCGTNAHHQFPPLTVIPRIQSSDSLRSISSFQEMP